MVTPLVFATMQGGYTNYIKLLLKAGADPNIPDDVCSVYLLDILLTWYFAKASGDTILLQYYYYYSTPLILLGSYFAMSLSCFMLLTMLMQNLLVPSIAVLPFQSNSL
jgi:hypothetical protein